MLICKNLAKTIQQAATRRLAAKPKFLARLCDRGLCTCGICIGMADSRIDDDVKYQIKITAEDEATHSTLDRIAGQALVLSELLDDLDTASAARLRPTLRILLEGVGRIIASEMVMDPIESDFEWVNLH
ncbi:hypothetical protein MKK75_06885 [Methylobacterium sp. J-030]|uniref:hypothetical protein n=1 Tax=Methylobacterium sp. J-030 TaxID=2836627 RepID=UPI001FB9FEF7|nr:hypothetical protein [Methylobacterium sp. J-030]MCJ2068531.1 hypothetical protein [Methylobacterium sp. J-030]